MKMAGFSVRKKVLLCYYIFLETIIISNRLSKTLKVTRLGHRWPPADRVSRGLLPSQEAHSHLPAAPVARKVFLQFFRTSVLWIKSNVDFPVTQTYSTA